MADSMSVDAAMDLVRDHHIVRVRFTPYGKTYHYALTGKDIARYGRPSVGDKIIVPGTSCDPEVVGFGRGKYNGPCKVARLSPPEMSGLAALVDSTGTLHNISPDAGTGIWTTQRVHDQLHQQYALNTTQETPTMNTYATKTPAEQAAEQIEEHEAIIADIKARQKAARKAEKQQRRLERERAAAAAERKRQQKVIRDTLESIATDARIGYNARVAAAVALGNLVG